MSEAEKAGVKVTEAHQSLQRWLEKNKGVTVPVEHVAAVVLNFPTWQRSPERSTERVEYQKQKDAEREAAVQAKREEQDRKRQAADEKRDKARAEADAKRKAADEKREQKRQDAIAKRAKADEDRKAKQELKDWLRAEKQFNADQKRQADEAAKAAKAAAKAEEPAANGEAATGRGALQDAKRTNRKLKRRTEESVGAGQSAGDF